MFSISCLTACYWIVVQENLQSSLKIAVVSSLTEAAGRKSRIFTTQQSQENIFLRIFQYFRGTDENISEEELLYYTELQS